MTEQWLEELRSGGAPSHRGGFEVDREKAREKLSKYRLPSPHYYVLEFIQAAHLLGASKIEVDVDADEVRIRFDGELLRKTDLESIYRTGFAGGPDVRRRAIRRLAIGLSAVWALDPAEVWIYAGDGDSAVRAEFDRDGQDRLVECAADQGAGNVLYVRERRRLSHLVDFFNKLRGELPEEALIRRHCDWTDVLIDLNGDYVSNGIRLPAHIVSSVTIENGTERGELGLERDWLEQTSRVRVLANGVSISVVPLPDIPFGVFGIMSSDRVVKSLSQTEITHNDAWESIRVDVLHDAAFRALAGYLADLDDDAEKLHAARLRDLAAAVWGYSPAGNAAAYDEVIDMLRDAPIWMLAHHSDGADDAGLMSLEGLRVRLDGDRVPTSRIHHRGRPSRTLPDVVLVTKPYEHVFEDVFGDRLVSMTDEVWRASERADLLTELEQLGHPAEPQPDAYLTHRRIEVDGVVGFVGVSERNRGAHGVSRIEWTNHELILDRTDASLDLGGVDFWFGGDLALRMKSPHFEVNEAYVEVAIELVMVLPGVIAEAADGLKRREVVRWLNDLTDAGTPPRLAADLGLPAHHLDPQLSDMHAAPGGPRWMRLSGLSPPATGAEVAERIRTLGRLATIPLLTSHAAFGMTMEDLYELHRAGSDIVVARNVERVESGRVGVLGGWKLELVLERFFGPISSDASTVAPRRPTNSSPPAETPYNATAVRTQIPERPTPTQSTQDEDRPSFVLSMERRLRSSPLDRFSVELAETTGDLVLELADAGYRINLAHPVIRAALEHRDSNAHQLWAKTAIFLAQAAGGDRREREFAFRQLVDLLEEQQP
jgi:hypothetical protein